MSLSDTDQFADFDFTDAGFVEYCNQQAQFSGDPGSPDLPQVSSLARTITEEEIAVFGAFDGSHV